MAEEKDKPKQMTPEKAQQEALRLKLEAEEQRDRLLQQRIRKAVHPVVSAELSKIVEEHGVLPERCNISIQLLCFVDFALKKPDESNDGAIR